MAGPRRTHIGPPSLADRIVLIAHRGESDRFPENTLLAFEEALKAGAGLLECDVHLTADGVLVVMHDDRLDRTTDRSGRIADLALRDIRSVSAGYPQRFGDRFAECRVPLLTEVLALVHGRARLLIEIKPEAVGIEDPPIILRALLGEVRRQGCVDHIGVISFHWGTVRAARALAPDVHTGILFHTWPDPDPWSVAREVGADFVILNKELTSRVSEPKVGARRASLGVYTVDDPAEIEPLTRRGVRAFATNRFASMIAALRAAGWGDRLDLSGESLAPPPIP